MYTALVFLLTVYSSSSYSSSSSLFSSSTIDWTYIYDLPLVPLKTSFLNLGRSCWSITPATYLILIDPYPGFSSTRANASLSIISISPPIYSWMAGIILSATLSTSSLSLSFKYACSAYISFSFCSLMKFSWSLISFCISSNSKLIAFRLSFYIFLIWSRNTWMFSGGVTWTRYFSHWFIKYCSLRSDSSQDLTWFV